MKELKNLSFVPILFIAVSLILMLNPGRQGCDAIKSDCEKFITELENAGIVDSLKLLSKEFGTYHFRILPMRNNILVTSFDRINSLDSISETTKFLNFWDSTFYQINIGAMVFKDDAITFSLKVDNFKFKNVRIIYDPNQINDQSFNQNCDDVESSYKIIVKKDWYIEVKPN